MAISISISLTQTSQSVSGNYSYVSATVKYSKSTTTWNMNGAPLSIVVNGSTVWNGDVNFPKGTTSGTLKTVTSIKIPHNSDGTKTVSASATLVSGTNSGTVKASTSKALTRIPRKSTLSVGNGTLNTGQTLTVTRQATSFTHTITAKCGSASTTICTKSTSESISFTPPLNWASQNTTGTSLTVTYTIATYSGTTNLGSNSYTKTCSIPSSVKPSVSISVSDAMGYSGTYGGWVQGKSKIAVSLTSSGSYGSTVKSRSTSVDGSKYTSASFTTGVIKGSGTLTISSTVTDSRGRTATDSENIAVLAYASPIISAVSATRCNSDGSANSSGAYIKVTFSGKVTALNNHNTATYSLKYKKTADTAYTTVTLSNYANAYTVTNGTYIFAADTISSYDIAVTAADNFSSVSKQTSGSSIKKIWSIWKKKFSIAFGKIADIENSVDFGLPAYFRQGIYFPGNFNSDFIKNMPLNLGTAEEIPNGADLNSYTTAGTYAVVNGTVAGSIKNSPWSTSGYKLIVQINQNANWFCQIAYTGANIRHRACNDGTWTDWSSVFIGSSDPAVQKTQRNNLGMIKVLWEGTWSSGKITIPNANQYRVFLLKTKARSSGSGNGTLIIAMKYDTWLRGMGGYSTATPTMTHYYFNAQSDSATSNTFNFIECIAQRNNATNDTELSVAAIYGVV